MCLEITLTFVLVRFILYPNLTVVGPKLNDWTLTLVSLPPAQWLVQF